MNPSWEPIIGSGFDAIGAQRANWANFNRGVEENNAARAFAAQEAANRWGAAASELSQRNAERAAAAQIRAQEVALGRRDQYAADAESRRRFDISTGLALSDQAIRGKHWDMNIEERTKQDQKDLDTASNYAKTKAAEVATAGQERDKAVEAYVQSQKDWAATVARLSAKLPASKFMFNRAAGQFALNPRSISTKLTEEEQKALNEANADLADAKGNLAEADEGHKATLKSWAELQREANGMGLVITKNGGKYVLYSARLGKPFEGEPAAPPPAPPVTDTSAPPDSSVGQQWAGFGDLTPVKAGIWGDKASPYSGSSLTPPYAGFNVAPAPVTKRWVLSPDGQLVLAQ